MIRRLIVLDFYFGSMCQLFAAMPSEVEVIALTPVSPGRSPGEIFRNIRKLHQNEFTSANCHERRFLVPGWSRAYGLTSALVDRQIKKVLGSPTETAIVYIFPQYARVAERHQDYLQVYFAVDPYTFYDWDKASVLRWEKSLHTICQCSMGVSRMLCDDFRHAGARHVVHVPNAVAESFLKSTEADAFRPADLPPADRLLVGCTGNMNDTYDWEFIADLARQCPEVDFVFLGPMYENRPDCLKRIRAVLDRPNVRWIGVCRHQDLPHYLRHFDVCLNPLRVNEQNHRRSPLRLYDYLSSGRFVLSTHIAEASEHAPYVRIARSSSDAAAFLRSINKGDVPADRDEMLRYIAQHTWRHRARQFLKQLEDLQPAGSGNATHPQGQARAPAAVS